MGILKSIAGTLNRDNFIKQNYLDKIRGMAKSNSEILENRAELSSRRYLASICFKISANKAQYKMNNRIFSPIGYYYGLFHLSLALLSLDINTDLNQLKQIHHTQLFNLVRSKLVQTNILDAFYFNTLEQLKELRESCNYRFGYSGNLDKDIIESEKNVNICFDKASTRIKEILLTSGTLFRFQVGIGDGFGDDITDTYLSKSDRKIVLNYIVTKGLST